MEVVNAAVKSAAVAYLGIGARQGVDVRSIADRHTVKGVINQQCRSAAIAGTLLIETQVAGAPLVEGRRPTENQTG